MRLTWVSTGDERKLCYDLRYQVFVLEQQVPPELELDHYDEVARHLMAVDSSGEVIATARIIMDTPLLGTAKIGRVAVRKELRGRGIASAMLRFLEQEARKIGQVKLELAAQLAVIPLYSKLGYTAYGPAFQDAGIDHRNMKLSLT